MNIEKRLRTAIKASGMNITKFSNVVGVPYGTLQQYLSGKRLPASEVLIKICTHTTININWLLTGEGNMHKEDETSELPRHTALLQLFDALDENQQREILATAEEKKRLNKVEQLLEQLLKKAG